MGGEVKKYIPAFIGLFVLAFIVRLISAEFTLNRYLEWAFWALIGTDSLARVMATRLEQARIPVGGTIGFVPNQFYRRKMPVVMHTRTGYNNGMVTWIPRRLEIFAVYDAYDPSPLNAYKELAVHESRHIAQMQGRSSGRAEAPSCPRRRGSRR